MMRDIICKGRNRMKREEKTAKAKLSTEYARQYQGYVISGKQIIEKIKENCLVKVAKDIV